MKKRLGILFILFILTGCTANYNLNIEGNTITENISGTVSKSEYEIKSSDTSENEIYSFLNNDQNALFDSDSVYLRTIDDKGNKINYNFTYTYNNNFNKSNIINTCFENHLVEENDEYLYVRLSGKFYCKYADKININVTSNNAVIETLTVIIQIASVVLLKRRVFLMTPIHHHFERLGWRENDIVKLFWIVGFILSLCALIYGVWL